MFKLGTWKTKKENNKLFTRIYKNGVWTPFVVVSNKPKEKVVKSTKSAKPARPAKSIKTSINKQYKQEVNHTRTTHSRYNRKSKS